MSDSGVVNIQVSVEQAEIDAAIASLDEAISSKTVKPGAPRKEKFVSKYADVPDNSWADKDQLRMLTNITEKKEKLQTELKGIKTFLHRAARMTPFVREADRVYKNVNRMSTGYGLIAALNFVLILKRTIKMIDQYMVKIDKMRRDMEVHVRENLNLNTRNQYREWKTQQQQARLAYRNTNR